VPVEEKVLAQLVRCTRCRRNQTDDVFIERTCYSCGKTLPCTMCKCGASMCLGCRVKAPVAAEPGKAEGMIYHPPPAGMNTLISVDMEWGIAHGWIFLTERKMTQKAFDRAVQGVYNFYIVLQKDLEKAGLAVAEDMKRCLQDLRPESRRVKRFVRPRPGVQGLQI